MLRRSIPENQTTRDLYLSLLQIFWNVLGRRRVKRQLVTPRFTESSGEEERRSSGQNTTGRGRSEESMSGVKRTWVYNKKYPTQSRSE